MPVDIFDVRSFVILLKLELAKNTFFPPMDHVKYLSIGLSLCLLS